MKYKNWNVFIQTGVYENKRMAIQIIDADDYCPIATATVNVEETSMKVDEAAIKDYSENQGILYWLIQQDIVKEIVRYVQSGWVNIPICKINLNKLLEYDPEFNNYLEMHKILA